MNRQDHPEWGVSRFSGVTDSGLAVHVFPRPDFRGSFALLAVKYGGCDLRFTVRGRWRDTPAGIAHYLEHKMFEMPDHHAMERFSAAGARANGFTSSDKTGYHFFCAEDFSENLAELFALVSTPYFTEETVGKERGIITQEIRMREDEPGRRVRTELMKALYAAHPIREGNLGTEESIARITPETLYSCHETFYRPDNMVLCCAGNVEPDAVFALASRLLPEKNRRKPPQRDYGAEEGPAPVRVRTEVRMPVSMPVFLLGSKLRFCPEGRDWQRLLLLAGLSCELFLGEGSPLYSAMYEEGLINAGFYTGVTDFPAGGVCCVGGHAADPQAVLGRIVDAAERLRADRDMAERFARLKKAAQGNFVMALDSFDSLCHTQADGHFLGWDGLDIPAVRNGLELEEAVGFLKDAFRADRLAVSVVRPLDQH